MTRAFENRSSGSDLQARRDALDPRRSFIVQAPAGSGKTGLLTQRFLKLLSGISAPEEILALTFTKKAAGEMRERILHALRKARTEPRPEQEHNALSWDLAHAALERDRKFGWQLEENPARLQVMTIDSLCSRLGHALPILSQFGASPQPVEDASPFYAEAARRTLAHLEDQDSTCQSAIHHLLLHLDNDWRKVSEQISEMLSRRDKWMRPLFALLGQGGLEDDSVGRRGLESALQRVLTEELELLNEAFPREHLYQVLGLLPFALEHVTSPHLLDPWRGITAPPGATPESMPHWTGLRDLLLTQKGDWRKQVAATHGFPAEKSTKDKDKKALIKANKAQMKAILGDLSAEEELRLRLHEVESLPPPHYTDDQWTTLKALLQVSLVAAGELLVVFKQWGKADFVEVAQRAERALGTFDDPTEVAMALDAKLEHILVDEFQDTSVGQLRLLEKLTAEWTPHEGRTLFLVGDPMQSVYRFRDAEVGLFLKIRQLGLTHLPLEFLALRSNFRSQASLVGWFNDVFDQVFPSAEDVSTGSVPYSWAEAAVADHDTAPLQLHPVLCPSWGDSDGKQDEADEVLRIIQETWENNPERRIAILARFRSNLATILPTLRRAGLRYQGVDIEPLENRPVVRDLLALTRALLHQGDRLAWLSILRAPWCGLTSDDLYVVADDDGRSTILDRLDALCSTGNAEDTEADAVEPESLLSDSGRARLGQLRSVLRQAVEGRRRQPLRRWVEGVWLSLGGPATAASSSDLEDAQAYLALLDRLGEEEGRPDLNLLEKRIAKLYAQPDVQADGRLQVMTIHKSKGLQFDTIILPGLSQQPPKDREPLLSWLERATPEGSSDLLLAPITEKGRDRDSVYRFVRTLETKKGNNELARVLYVAATRAERKLHLVSRVVANSKSGDFGTLAEPQSGSFLKLLWPALQDDFTDLVRPQFGPEPLAAGEASPFDLDHPWAQTAMATQTEVPDQIEDKTAEVEEQPTVRRLCDDWVPPPTPLSVEARSTPAALDLDLEERPVFEWAGETVRRVGSVVHRVLQQVGHEGLSRWSLERVEGMEDYLRAQLSQAGVPPDILEAAVIRAQKAIKETLESAKGRWIFEQDAATARNEYAISGLLRGRLVRAVVDRTFIDETGTRWIVDYKTGTHEGADPEGFLDAEQERYRPQLERYSALLRRLDPERPIKMGLYFPLLGGWREWAAERFQRHDQLQLEF